jgi:uncharacterized protein (DUF885 family)
MKRFFLSMALAAIAFTTHAQRGDIDTFFNQFSDEWVRNTPNLAVSNRYFAGDEQARLERQLTRLDDTYQRERVERAQRGLASLSQFDRAAMTEAQRLSADVLQYQLQTIVDGEPYRDYGFPFEQMRGVHVGLIDALTVSHPLQSKSDANNYLARLALVSARLDEAVVAARRIAAKGLIPPRFILETTIAQMKTFEQSAPRLNPLVETLMSKLEPLKELSDADRRAIEQQAASTVESQIYPAWRRATAFLESLLPRSTNAAGLWRFAGGSAAYAYQLRANTTTRLSADEIHAIGLRRVAEIEAEMNTILVGLGRPSGSVKERVEQLEKEQAYPLTDAGRAAIMRDLNTMLKDAQERARTMFDVAPKAPVTIEAFPRYREATAPGTYNAPSPDGSRPGVFRIPLRPSYMTKFGTRSLVYHETVPGHHFQIAINRENTSQPKFRQLGVFGGFTAASEGWGLYAERLAIENGWYDDDPIGRLGALDSELFRARRLVVDTGLHAKRWTRQQAIDYGIEASEIDRYVVQPGQACAYMIGQLKYIELREKARKALGQKFSVKDFHTAVLRMGILPLDILEREVDRYIQSRL